MNPTSGYMINQNIRSANPPKAALQMYSSTFRLGNNSDVILISILEYVNHQKWNFVKKKQFRVTEQFS